MLLRPRWLAWHAFAVLAIAGMLWLGRWQLHRAESGNELSWAYTFEWPLFAVFGVYFWAKTLRDELRHAADPGREPSATAGPAEGAGRPGSAATAQQEQTGGNSGDGERVAADAYLARLRAEVHGHGKWHGWR
jgi:DNA-binding transcriptional regulator of glucitol operon